MVKVHIQQIKTVIVHISVIELVQYTFIVNAFFYAYNLLNKIPMVIIYHIFSSISHCFVIHVFSTFQLVSTITVNSF